MTYTTWLVFFGVALFMAFSPGPAVLLAISSSISYGAARALWGSLGNATGIFLVAVATTAGLGVILKASATAFLIVKLLGGAYLIFLGIRQWREPYTPVAVIGAGASTPGGSALQLFRRGLVVALANPKSIFFFTALFPQFMVSGAGISSDFLILAVTFVLCTFVSHVVYVGIASRVRRTLSSPRRQRLFNRLTGGGLVVFGGSVLALKNSAP